MAADGPNRRSTEESDAWRNGSYADLYQRTLDAAIERVGTATRVAHEIGIKSRENLYVSKTRPNGFSYAQLQRMCTLANIGDRKTQEFSIAWFKERASSGNFRRAILHFFREVDQKPDLARRQIYMAAIRDYVEDVTNKRQGGVD